MGALGVLSVVGAQGILDVIGALGVLDVRGILGKFIVGCWFHLVPQVWWTFFIGLGFLWVGAVHA